MKSGLKRELLSVVIITYNEEKNIRRCLESVREIADEIVVVDSFSTDNTKQICQEYAVHFIERAFTNFGEQKNFALSASKNQWVLSLDADEALDAIAILSIQEILLQPTYELYQINRITQLGDQWIRHSKWYPDWKIRLFNKNIVQWSTSLVHESIEWDPLRYPVGICAGHINHYSYTNYLDLRNRSMKYASLATEEYVKRKTKIPFWKPMISAIVKFISLYIMHLGVLDGKAGLQIAWISGYCNYLKYQNGRKILLNQIKQ